MSSWQSGRPARSNDDDERVVPWRPSEGCEFLVLLIRGRWTLPVLARLFENDRRYQDLFDAVDGISYKVLTETLRRAERDGLVGRHLDGERIETATLYELTDLGRSLDAPPLMSADEDAAERGSEMTQPSDRPSLTPRPKR